VNPLVRFGLKQRVLMNLLFIGLVAFGLGVALPRIPIDRYPNFDFGEAIVVTTWSGATAEEVERLVTVPLEDAIRAVDDIEYVRCTSRDGASEIIVKFEDDTDYAALFDDLRFRVLATQNRLPVADGQPLTPIVTRMETDVWLPVIQVNLVAGDGSPADLQRLGQLAEDLRDRLTPLPGMKRVEVEGLPEVRFEIALDPLAMQRHGLTAQEIADALRGSGGSEPAGRSRAGGTVKTVVAESRYRSLEQVLAVVVRRDGEGRLVTVGEVADLPACGPRVVERGIRVHCDGRPSVVVKILKERDAQATELKAEVQAETDRFLALHADERIAAVYNLDSTTRVGASLSVLTGNLWQGAVLVLGVLLLFLGWRMAVLAASGVLFAFLGALTVMYLTGQSLNEITLLALVLVAGILDDDVIVVVDNIQRKREEGLSGSEAILAGASEVFWPLVAASATTIGAFLPLLLMTGTTGEFFSLLPITVVVALAVSLFECVFLVPTHIADLDHWFGPGRVRALDGGDETRYLTRSGLTGMLARLYDRILRLTLARPRATLAGVGALLLLALAVLAQSAFAPSLGQRPILRLAFFPEDLRVLNLTIRTPAGTPLEATDTLARRIAADLAADKERFAAVSGLSGMYIDTSYKPVWGDNHALLFVELRIDGTSDVDAIATLATVRQHVETTYETGGVQIEVGAQKDGPPTDAPLVARFAGSDDAAVVRAALALRDHLAARAADGSLPGLVDLRDDAAARSDRLVFRPDAEAAARFGLTPRQVVSFIAGANEGAYVGEFRQAQDDIPLVVRLTGRVADDPAALVQVPIALAPDGRALRYGEVGTLAVEQRPAQLTRRDFRRTVTITGDLAPDSPLSAIHLDSAAREWWDGERSRHPSVDLAFGGEAQATARSYASLLTALVVAVFVIYVVLATQFRSYLQPALILTNVLFGFIGVTLMMGLLGILALALPEGWVRPERAMFTVQTFIAIVGLTGMVVSEAIVLVEFINARRADGLALHPALLTAGHQRLRPILMATTTTIAGLLPMAIGIPAFSVAWSPMATAFVAGLMMSTALTLVVLPAGYLLLERRRADRRTPP
jgi:HAE1 family hydrophobic/amphiphilic exporter-1